MNRKPTLFYSKKCPHCAEVLNKIRMAPAAFGSSFEYIIIDGNRNLPSFLKEVPTLVVPTHPQPITGDAVFMWIDTQVRMSAQQQRAAPQQQSQPQLSNANQKKVEGAILNHMDGLSFYNAMEMSGFGDNYLSLEDENGGQEHCFVFIDDKGNKQVQCVPASNNAPSYNPNQFNQKTSQQQVPDWLKPQTVGRNNEQNSVPNYNPNQNAGGSMTMSQQNNIRLQQEARGLPPMMNFQDPQRVGMNETSKLNDMDYEKYASMRDNDPRIMPATQRI
jgi:hypothetical protein